MVALVVTVLVAFGPVAEAWHSHAGDDVAVECLVCQPDGDSPAVTLARAVPEWHVRSEAPCASQTVVPSSSNFTLSARGPPCFS